VSGHRGSTAVAIFVKTPGLNEVKTRLARGVGISLATEFHRRAAAAVAAMARSAMPTIMPYWAVAEREGLRHPLWRAFPTCWQGDGGLAARLNTIYANLQERPGRALLIGADAPQVTAALLLRAASWLAGDEVQYLLGPARDGGFWLFGGNAPVAEDIWHRVPYSQADTGQLLADAIRPLGTFSLLPTLTDTDFADDLPRLLAELAALGEMPPEQARLMDWLRVLLADAAHVTAEPTVLPRKTQTMPTTALAAQVALLNGKFQDPDITARGEPRARVALRSLETLWFNTGTLCNLTCANCYIESSPRNDRLSYLSRAEVARYLQEIAQRKLPTRLIGFTGGEPCMNADLPGMLEDVMSQGFDALVLTNAMKPMRKMEAALPDLNRTRTADKG